MFLVPGSMMFVLFFDLFLSVEERKDSGGNESNLSQHNADPSNSLSECTHQIDEDKAIDNTGDEGIVNCILSFLDVLNV